MLRGGVDEANALALCQVGGASKTIELPALTPLAQATPSASSFDLDLSQQVGLLGGGGVLVAVSVMGGDAGADAKPGWLEGSMCRES